MKIYIYGLIDGNDVYYIGKTSNIEQRITGHIRESYKNITEKDKKIQCILFTNKRIPYKLLYICNETLALAKEESFIKEYSERGHKLLNIYHNTAFNLSKIEIDLLYLISKDYDTVELGEKLFRSPRTIETIRQKLKDKAGVKTTGGLVMWGIDNNILIV